ncbi:MAG: glutamate-cysteine ligase family protein [Actinomycetota bacterium]|nr:glutamate-cysteine ligase family protein [Actinomycetota bacterium]MDP9475719.1 glutamate-cysteine ligase family protein [Actinomycetota bacterium]MDP9485534.1 glutamate-cysteine ligase family protein [Actinomycetota bacterium]
MHEENGLEGRRVGLEQEFFLVESSGLPSQRADEFLDRCGEEAGGQEGYFAPEFVKGLVEVNTSPVHTLTDLEREYAGNLRLALGVARTLGLRLYPLGTYPLPLRPVARGGSDYRVQVGTVGPERFEDAGRCAGTHLHLELPAGTVSADAALDAGAAPEARNEALNLYNLATALDPALVALTRSCPYYEGRATGLAARTVHYRGSAAFGWDGVYTDLPQVGALLPYADDAEHLVRQQFDRYRAWLRAMDRAGVERRLFVEAGGDLLRPAWNPVRLNRQGTLELRGMDSNFPEVTLAVAALILGAAHRVRREGLEVTPVEGLGVFEVAGGKLRVPGFGRLGGELLRAAATGGVEDPGVLAYLDSILEFAAGDDRRLAGLGRHRRTAGRYPTTEAAILGYCAPENGILSEEEGLRVVLRACDELEAQVTRLAGPRGREGEQAIFS